MKITYPVKKEKKTPYVVTFGCYAMCCTTHSRSRSQGIL